MGPYCVAEDGRTHYCSPNATRTHRSGVYDLEYMARDDRRYWCADANDANAHRHASPLFPPSPPLSLRVRSEIQFARERLAPESGADIEACRTNLTARIARCELTCDSCAAECTSTAARNLVSAWRCSFGLPVLGTIAALQASDQGQQVANQWGADRTKDQPAAPDNAWTEQYTTLVQNSVDRPRVARGGISCRKAHRESTTGGYVPALDAEGRYVRRTGFMVGCNTDLDCYSRCGGLNLFY